MNIADDFRFFKKRKDKSFRELIKRNAQFKNVHQGERCFILGNGPSLKKENLKCLEKELVFSVNQIARHPDFDAIKPTYHFWADPTFFQLDQSKSEDRELLDIMKKVNTSHNSPMCFFPIEQKDFVQRNHLDKELKVSYFYSHQVFYDGYKKEIDYSHSVPAFGTVVQWCITMAIYMGFSEIYLLGCDTTSLLVNIKSALELNDNDDYAYSISENEKRRMAATVQTRSLENYTKSYLETLRAYRLLFDYCSKKGIRLVNCSASTVIDSIPREKLSDVISKRGNQE